MNIYKIKITDLNGTKQELEGPEGYRVMEVIRDNGVQIRAECNGCASCATCHVYVAEEWLPKLHPQSDEERKLLSDSYNLQPNSRLSCQILMSEELDGLELTLSPDCE